MSKAPDFLDLMRVHERAKPEMPRIGASGSRAEEIVILGQEPHIEFSATNVNSQSQSRDGKPLVLARFLGLLGPQGALPLHTSYDTVHWTNMRDPAFSRFLDIFNHRFLQLFYRTWANARPVVQADRARENQFVAYLGAAVGIGTVATQSRGTMPDFTKLALAGLLSSAVKSASRLEHMIAWMFKVDVAVEQHIGVWLAIEEHERSSLSKGKCGLGVESLIGRSAFSLSDKFRIRIAVKNLPEFESFLPDGKFFQLLADAVAFYLGHVLIYDVALGLAANHAAPMQLGKFGRLGWTSWMGKDAEKVGGQKRWDCRFHPAEL